MTTLTKSPDTTHLNHLESAANHAKSLPANTVQVWPGGAKFTTIQDALASIQDASPQLQYQVAVGAGTYTGMVNLKDNVFISGAGQDQTFLTREGQAMAAGTLMTQGNCGAGMMSIAATGVAGNSWCVPVYLANDGTFTGTGLTLTSTDSGIAGMTICGVTNMGGSNAVALILSNCSITATTVNNNSTTYGIQLMAPMCSLNIELSTVVGSSPGGVGIVTASQATATVEGTTVTGANWSLQNYDNQSPITATGCTLNGPVSAGVVVNP